MDKKLNSGGKKIRHVKKKVIIIGEGGVGKTTLLYKYVNNIFIDSMKMTIGSDFYVKKIKHIDEKYEHQANLLLWDFAGQERFRFVVEDYIKGAESVILAFDLTQFTTLEKLLDWIDLLKKQGAWNNPDIKYFLVGTKNDLTDTLPIIKQDLIDEFIEKFGIQKFYKTSAKKDENINELFKEVALALIYKDIELEEDQ